MDTELIHLDIQLIQGVTSLNSGRIRIINVIIIKITIIISHKEERGSRITILLDL